MTSDFSKKLIQLLGPFPEQMAYALLTTLHFLLQKNGGEGEKQEYMEYRSKMPLKN